MNDSQSYYVSLQLHLRQIHHSGQTEIRDLQLAALVDEEIGRLQVSMNDRVAVQILDALDELLHQRPTYRSWDNAFVCVYRIAEVLVHIDIDEFQDELDLTSQMDDII